MDFLNKVNAFAKAAADKTNEVVEDTKLKNQIANDEKSIRELEIKIGAHYYQKFIADQEVDAEVTEYCTAISVHKANIEEKKEALAAAKKEPEAAPEEEAPETEEPFEQE